MILIQLNLLPYEHQHRRSDISWLFDRRVVWPTFLIFVAAFAAIMLWWTKEDQIRSLSSEKEIIQNKIDNQKPVLNEINNLHTNLEEIRKKNLALKSIQVSKQKWITVFEAISSQLPPNTWLLSIQQGDRNPSDTSKTNDHSNELKLVALSYKFDEVAKYMEQLVSVTKVVDSVSLASVEKVHPTNTTDSAYQMHITAYLNPYIGIEDSLTKPNSHTNTVTEIKK